MQFSGGGENGIRRGGASQGYTETLFLAEMRDQVKLAHRSLVMQGISGAGLIRIFSSSKLLLALVTFFRVNVTCVFFRAPDFSSAWSILTSMFTTVEGGATVLTSLTIIKVLVVITLMLVCHWLLRNRDLLSLAGKMRWWVLGIVLRAMVILLMLSQESTNSFIYFQF